MNRLSHALPLLLMLMLGGLSLWLKQAIESPAEGPRAPVRHEADARVDRFSVIQLDKDGKPELKLSAEHMVHYGDDDSTELAAPRLTKTAPEATLSVSADRGTVTHDYNEAYFYDNVKLSRQAPPPGETLQVATSFLHADVRRDVIRTDRPVTITQGRSVLSGTGLEYDRASGKLALLADVKATIDARRR
jgi:lipopolysaccharide export system protein LptC